jgi:glutathione synthase/RimK-type ligase-like ATP-grasp enzyme
MRAWNDPAASFADFAAVVLRSNWDYHFAPDAFLEWLEHRERTGIRLWNPPALVRWNLTKRYLLDLAAAGVPVVPTAVLEGPAEDLPALLAERGWATAVVKPLVSASAHDTTLVAPGEAARVASAIARGQIRSPVLVQPFVEEIRTRGD